jgi:hypothetical protein
MGRLGAALLLMLLASGPVRAGHGATQVEPEVRRYTGVVTEPGKAGGHSFKARLTPVADAGEVPQALTGWRLTMIGGKRYSHMFEISRYAEGEITVSLLDGPVDGIAVDDKFLVEELAVSRARR